MSIFWAFQRHFTNFWMSMRFCPSIITWHFNGRSHSARQMCVDWSYLVFRSRPDEYGVFMLTLSYDRSQAVSLRKQGEQQSIARSFCSPWVLNPKQDVKQCNFNFETEHNYSCKCGSTSLTKSLVHRVRPSMVPIACAVALSPKREKKHFQSPRAKCKNTTPCHEETYTGSRKREREAS